MESWSAQHSRQGASARRAARLWWLPLLTALIVCPILSVLLAR